MGKQWEQWQALFWGAPNSLQMVTAAMKLKDVRSLEEKLTNLDSILKSRDITLPTDVHLVKAMGFPVVVYGCESWTVKKAESRRIDAFELWYWWRLLRVPWTARRFYNITSYSLLGGNWCICSIAEVNKGYLCNQAFVGCPWKKLLGKMGIDNLKYSLSYSSPS